jgi:hypothetical protein
MSYHLLPFLAKLLAISPAMPLPQAEPPLGRLVNTLIVLSLLLLSSLCFMALILLLAAFLPRVMARSQQALLSSPWRAFFIGLANYLFLGGIALVLLNIEPLAWLGVLITAALSGLTLLGLTGSVSLLGERLAVLQSGDVSPLKRLIWGAITLELACLLPFIGWFLLAPILFMLSFGAAILAWRNRRQSDHSWEEIQQSSLS